MEKTENSKSNNSRRRLSIVAALVLVVAVICGGGLWRHRTAVQEHNRAFASYRAAAKTYKVQESEYHRYLASDEVKAASTVTDDQVSDAKTVHALAKGVQVVKPASGRTTGAKTNLTGDASTSELKKATNTLNAQTSKLKSKLKDLKADVLAVTTSQAHKLLSDAIGNGDKVLADSDGKVPDGDQRRNDLAKGLDSAKNILNDKKSVFRAFADVKADLDAKVKSVNDAVSAKAQADVKVLYALPRWLMAVTALLHVGAATVIEPPPKTAAATIVHPPEEATQLPPRAATVTAVLIVTLLGLAQPMVQMEKLIGKVII